MGLRPCQWRYCPRPSCCHSHLPDGLPLWSSVLLLLPDIHNLNVLHLPSFLSLLPPSYFWCHWSILPSWHFTPTRLEDNFFCSSSFQDCSFSSSFDEPFYSFPTLSLFPRAVSIAFCSSYIMFSLQAISSADTSLVIISMLMTNKSSSASLIVLLVIFSICPSLKLCHFKVLSALTKLVKKS